MRRMTRPNYTRATRLPEILQQRIVIIDGAMGTMLQARKLTESHYRGTRFAAHGPDLRGSGDVLNLRLPDVVREIHAEYLAAGADLIETNTFGATRIAQEDYGLAEFAREINVAAAQIARSAVDAVSSAERLCFVAGALGPTPR